MSASVSASILYNLVQCPHRMAMDIFGVQSSKDCEFATTLGRKATVPYALYQMHGFISAADAKKTGN